MSNNRVTRLFMAVMVAGALVGCGSEEVAQETTPVAEASVAEATVEENAVDAAASTEESVVEENVVEEVEPQTETRKVLAGYVRVKDGVLTDADSIIYDEFGNPVKLIYNDYTNEELKSVLMSGELSASDFMNFGEKYVSEYAEVTKSEDGMILEMDWYTADGTNENDHVTYTHNEFGSDLTEDNATCHIEYTYDESGKLVGEHGVYTDGTEYSITSDNITSEVDEDGTVTYKSAAGSLATVEYYYYYTTIEVPVQ